MSKFFGNYFFQIIFLHGKKENFEEYSLNLAYAELSFPTLTPKIPCVFSSYIGNF
jgi:hypothetical protein